MPKTDTRNTADFIAALKPYGDQYYRVSSKPLAGRPILITGGGPNYHSAAQDLCKKLPQICANNSYLVAGAPSLVVALDRRWFGWHSDAAQAMGHQMVTAMRDGQYPATKHKVFMLRKDPEPFYVEDPGVLCGKNSGHAAIHLAIHLGSPRIYLAGFDMGFTKGRSHWHSGHVIPASETNYVSRFRPRLEKLARFAERDIGVRIMAVTPTQADIPTAHPRDMFEDFRRCNEQLG